MLFNSVDESSLLNMDLDEKLKPDEKDFIILNATLTSPKTILMEHYFFLYRKQYVMIGRMVVKHQILSEKQEQTVKLAMLELLSFHQ